MNNRLIILFALIAISSMHHAPTQEWTEPVQVNTLQGYNAYPDFYIGNDGTIHCVWSYRVIEYHKVIYYSKSTNDGLTWSNPENVTQNDSLWMENPQIVADSENNLHLTYDYNVSNPGGTLIMHRNYNGETWSEPDTVSPGWFGARHNKLIIDNNDLIYCFWFHDFQNGVTMYSTLNNEVWGEIVIPYDDNDLVGFQKGVFDDNNNMHCTGGHFYEGQTPYDMRVISFSFIDNTWQPWIELSDNKSWGGNDIALFSTNQPAIVWGQDINDSIPPTAGTLFSFNNGTAMIDLGYTYMLMEYGGYKGAYKGKLLDNIPTSKSQYIERKDYLLSLTTEGHLNKYILRISWWPIKRCYHLSLEINSAMHFYQI